ncbi:MAG: dihydrofolate reductase family protein [Micrococcaceae bacterium]
MGKVILHVIMSLDGFMADKHDSVDWSFQYGAPSNLVDEVKDSAGAIVLGKRTYDGSIANGHPPYGGSLKVPLFVVTSKAHDSVQYKDLTFSFVTEGVEQAVTQAKAAAGDKNVILLGGSIYQQCLKAGLIDEIVIHLVPLLLSEGVEVFKHLGESPIKLKRIDAKIAEQMTDMRFKVVK